MASAPLTFRTPHIEEIPIAHAKQAPGFAWVSVPKEDPAKKQLEVAGKKRARNASTAAPSEAQKDALSSRRLKDVERRIRELNTDGAKDANIAIPGKDYSAGAKAGKTPNTKKILASGKEFKHYLDDEEAELARTGRVDGAERDVAPRPSKMPIARRAQHEDSKMIDIAAPVPLHLFSQHLQDDLDADEFDGIPPLPSAEIIQALLDAPPLTYNAARLTPSYAPSAPPRQFCEICGFFGRVKCLKCGAQTCSVKCEDVHNGRCLKFYA